MRKLTSVGSAVNLRLDGVPPRSDAFDVLAGDTPFRDRISVPTTASPQAVFAALKTVTLSDMRLAWLLGELRYLPSARPSTGRRSDETLLQHLA